MPASTRKSLTVPMTERLPPPKLVTTPKALNELSAALRDESLIAVDTESNSLFAYRERVCLVQLSTRRADWIIDPLTVEDLSPLGPIFADARIEKVFHAAEYDIMCLKRDYGFAFAALFDTMIAARIVGWKAFGLAAMLEEHFGIQLDKRFQRADWSLRPIPAEQLAYAQLDTHYLPALRDILHEEIRQRDGLDEAIEIFGALADTPAAAHSFDPEGYWNITAAQDLNRHQMAVLRELYLLRDEIARRRDQPPFKVMSDEALVAIVRSEPGSIHDLYALRGVGRGLAARFGPQILRAIARGMAARPPNRPERSPRMDPATLARYHALRDWRKARAAERGVESDVIIPKEAVLALARSVPRTLEELEHVPGLGPWRRSKYGDELLRVLQSAQATNGDS